MSKKGLLGISDSPPIPLSTSREGVPGGRGRVKTGYKLTKLGWIPEEWELKTFGDISKINQELQIVISERFTKPVANGHFYITNEFLKENSDYKYYIVNPPEAVLCTVDDILMTRTGNTGQVVTGVVGAFHNNFFKINFDNKKLNKEYLFYYLNSPNTQYSILKLAGTSTIPDLNHSDFYSILIPLPSLFEQHKIAKILTTWDKAIEKLEQLITKKQELKKGLMQALLTGKKRFSGFTEEWKEVNLGELGSFAKGKGITKSEVIEDGFPCVRYGELYTQHHIVIKQFTSFIPPDIAIDSKRIYQDDILFAGSGETAEEIGKAAVFLGDEEAYAGGDIIIFTPKRGSSLFLAYLLDSEYVIKQKRMLGQGHSVVHIYSKDIQQLKVCFPPVEEQRKIAAVLGTADKEIENLKLQRDNLKEQKRGLMQALLTGKVRVNVNGQ